MKRQIAFLLLFFVALMATAQSNKNFTLIMRTTGYLVLWNNDTITTYGFATKLSQNPPVPGPVLTVNEGDSVFVLAKNISQGPPHTIHFHGLDVNQANDGTPSTSFELHHMEDSTYRFKAAHAGTYIYHCHMGDVVHVQMGMYGLVIVKAAGAAKTAWTGGPTYDKEYSWLTSEIDKHWHDSIPNTEHDSTMTGHEMFMIPKYIPDYFLVNGKSKQQIGNDTATSIYAKKNELVYLRLGNIGYLKNQYVFPSFLHAKVIDSDGRPLPASFDADTVYVSPGERYGVMLHPSLETNDGVSVNYISMNTGLISATEYVPVQIHGVAGINELPMDDGLIIYPNPADEEVMVHYEKAIEIKVTLMNVLGELVLNPNPAIQTVRLNTSELKPGVYLLKAETGEKSLVRKIVVE